jgi:hypothetical protein
MSYSDIIGLKEHLDGEPTKVHIDCNECDSFWTTAVDDPLFDAMITVAAHEGKTGHRDYDVGVEVLAVIEEIDAEITIGETVES